MDASAARDFVDRAYARRYGADGVAGYRHFMVSGDGAVLGYRRAVGQTLFLEHYLEAPIETAVSHALGRVVGRDAIVEIGNLATTNAFAMIDLWGAAANDLGTCGDIAVATLTRSLRRQLRRVGIEIVPLARAMPDCLGDAARRWGSYYAQDPWVCAGSIPQGQAAIGAFLARRPTGTQA